MTLSDSQKSITNSKSSAPPVRARVLDSPPTFKHIGSNVLFIGEVLKNSYHAFSTFFAPFWLQFFVRACLLSLLSVGIYYGLLELKNSINLSNISGKALYFAIFTFELTIYAYMIIPVIFSAICKVEPKYRHLTIYPSLLRSLFYYWIIAAILGSITFLSLEIHLSLAVPFILLSIFAFPSISIFQLNPFQAIHVSFQIFARNLIPTLTLLTLILFGSIGIGYYCWSLANYRLPLIFAGILPAIPWIPFLFLIYSSIFTMAVNTEPNPLRRVYE